MPVLLTLATAGLLLLHAPPVTASLNVVEPPTQAVVLPVMAGREPLTDTVAVRTQPAEDV
jgi:hypothetical protein